jgi:acetolactate synthase-1/2/3 large subunit
MYKAKALQPPGKEDLTEAAKILAAAKRPTILCGLGAAQGKAEAEVRALDEYLGAPLTTTLYAAGFCSQYPLDLGVSGGLGVPLAVDTLAESDVMIVVGASLNEWTTHFGKILENDKKIIQIDDREDAFGWFARITLGLEADSKVAVAALIDRLKQVGKPARQPDAQTVEKLKHQKPPAISYEDGKWVDPRRAANYLEERLPKGDRILVLPSR